MFKKIIGTAGSKIIIAAISLLIVFINARFLGAEGVGTIGLIVLGITIILMVNNFIGGTTLVYLVPREENFKLLFISYIWAFIVTLLFWVVLKFFAFVPIEYAGHVLILSLIFSFSNINLYVILGKQKIREYNIITTFQYIFQIGAIVLFFLILHWCTVMVFVKTLYISYGFAFISSFWVLSRSVKRSDLHGLKPVLKRIFQLGSFVQIAFVIQMMNYRLSYYIIDFFVGRAGLGMFHFGNQLAEGTWVVGKSVAIVQYSGISNSDDRDYAKRLTLRLMKLTFLASAVIILFFLILPDKVFLFFGKDFSHTRVIMVFLSVGILSNAVAMMFSHYFAGIGKPQVNTIGSSIGLVFTVGLGFWLIPTYGILGAAVTASFSYLSTLIFEVWMFVRYTKPRARDFIITYADYKMVKEEIGKLLKKEKMEVKGIDENIPQ